MKGIKQHLQEGGSERVEFVGADAAPNGIARHVVAMLNGEGGSIHVGVDDAGHAVGLVDAQQNASVLQQKLNRLISPRALFDVVLEEVDGRATLTITVPKGANGPYMCEGKVYLREGQASRVATVDEMHRWLQRSVSETIRWERRPAVELTAEELDLQEVERTTQEPESRVRLQTTAERDPESILKAFGMLTQGRYTNAADVCFAKDPSVRNPQVRIRAFAFEKDKGGNYRDHRDIHGPLANVIEQAEDFVRRNSSLSALFPESSMRREVKTEFPSYAVREGIVNAVAHRDYASFSSGVSVMLYPDRLEVWNSGALPPGWNAGKLKKDHQSLPSNPDIAHYLYVRLFMERIGRGTQKIVDACREAELQDPKWKVDKDGVTLILFSSKAPGPKESKPPERLELKHRMHRFLQTIEPGRTITTLEYTRLVSETITERQARRDLQDLVELGYLRKEGSTKATRYIRTETQAPSEPTIRT